MSSIQSTIEKSGKAGRLLQLQAAGFPVPEFVVSPDDLHNVVRQLGMPLAVRSSASVEDGHAVSFAGQFQSFLNLETVSDVEQAIQRCHASLNEPSVIEYCLKNGIDPHGIRMDVIVQKMVQPVLAGVAFTVNPVTGSEEVSIEACAGLSNELLAGHGKPLPADHPLMQRYRDEIVTVSKQIQRHFGAPQDIEFAIAGDELFILQSRPITRIGFSADIGEWTNADFRDGGVSSSVCSPLMWSLYDFVWDRTLKDSLRELRLYQEDFDAGRMFFGRPYWNLGALKKCLLRLPGFVERQFDEDLSVQITYQDQGRTTPVSLGRVLFALPTLLAARRYLRVQQQKAEQLLSRNFVDQIQKYEPLPADVDAKFRELIEEDYLALEGTYFRTIFASSLAKMDFVEAFPDVDYAPLVAGLPALRHMAPVRALQELPDRNAEQIDALITRFGHHYRIGLDIIHPRWHEDRSFVVKMLSALPATAGVNPRSAYEDARAKVLARLSNRKRRKFIRKLDRLRRFLWLREELRDISNQMYSLIRRYVLQIGNQHGVGDEIFFATFQDIFSADWSNISGNRERFESFRLFRAPNEIGAPFAQQSIPSGESFTGIAASPGTASGFAFVAMNVEEAAAMPSGHILICPFSDPGWTPVLDRAIAVVTETGGQLSHAAIICREYGIPAVLGVTEATRRIPHGTYVTVYGQQGCVKLGSPHS